MKNPKKSNPGKKRRQSGNRQAYPRQEQNVRVDASNRPSGKKESGSCEGRAPSRSERRDPQHEHLERIRKQWEGKQVELASRWTAAQSRRAEEDKARSRKMKIVWGATGAVTAALLGAIAWYRA
jgi:hypothetical protein